MMKEENFSLFSFFFFFRGKTDVSAEISRNKHSGGTGTNGTSFLAFSFLNTLIMDAQIIKFHFIFY